MKKHTPGPWKVMYSTPLKGESALAVWPADTVDGAIGSPICKVSPESLENETDQANATLIAAAPDLLHELEMLVDYVMRELTLFHPDVTEKEKDFIVSKAQKAIAKAKGQK